ncbi:hypothetical protein DM02DRAFT_650934 [Periconia macrospinosa]|uniref:Uncharacterized protein n=1 Tax=Periconia macrospinosa TaxID=97972 RepID=A0A2V1E407_9PLEO|nr:hypothetical protein DM02DRAFT_650934 [Periconia macrospinosa]
MTRRLRFWDAAMFAAQSVVKQAVAPSTSRMVTMFVSNVGCGSGVLRLRYSTEPYSDYLYLFLRWLAWATRRTITPNRAIGKPRHGITREQGQQTFTRADATRWISISRAYFPRPLEAVEAPYLSVTDSGRVQQVGGCYGNGSSQCRHFAVASENPQSFDATGSQHESKISSMTMLTGLDDGLLPGHQTSR